MLGEPKIYFEEESNPLLQNLLKKMLRFDVEKRPNAE